MKNTRRLIAAATTLAMVSALAPMAVFAENKGMTVSYTYNSSAPTYTVTIPSGVTLSDSVAVEASITAEGVANMEANRKKIVVKLDSATNDTGIDTKFHAMNGASTATYTIKAGETAVKVGDTVAEFTANGSSVLTFSKITFPESPVAGNYTETLTFGISVEDAAYVPKTFTSLSNGTILRAGDTLNFASGEYYFPYYSYPLTAGDAPFTVLRANIAGLDDGPGAPLTVTENGNGAYYVIKSNSNYYFDFEGRLEVTGTSDGVIVTANASDWAISVYEP